MYLSATNQKKLIEKKNFVENEFMKKIKKKLKKEFEKKELNTIFILSVCV